jgi:hypothetical protein
VFRIEADWLLVCETSVRLITGQEEVSRLEFGDAEMTMVPGVRLFCTGDVLGLPDPLVDSLAATERSSLDGVYGLAVRADAGDIHRAADR